MFAFLFTVFLIVIYIYGTRNYSYWLKKNVKHDRPLPIVGNHLRQFLQRISLADMLEEQYNKYPNEKIVGFYTANDIHMIVRDLDIVKNILVTDFEYFYPRGLNPYPRIVEPLLKNLFFADGDLWKLLRQKITPVFTSGKLKSMFGLIKERADKLQKRAEISALTGSETDVRELMAQYTTEFIGACGFGLNIDALNEQNSMFRRLGKRIFTITKRDSLVSLLKMSFPYLFRHLNFLASELERTTMAIITSIMTERNYKPSGRNDFIDHMLEIKSKGAIVSESIENKNEDGTPKKVSLELDDSLIAAQVFVFFGAGFETSSSASSYTLHELAYHPEVQRKCQIDVDAAIEKHGGLTYEAVNDMKYLKMAMKEAMRLLPPLGFLIRESAKEYAIPGTDIVIDKEVTVTIPIQAIQRDEKYFDDPEEFRPERFENDLKGKSKDAYMPFGAGPRACIGERLGMIQAMAGLAAILHKFTVVPSENSSRRPVIDPSSIIVQSISGGLPLKLLVRNKKTSN